MPGRFGTLEEMFEVLSLTQLGYHKKPVGLLNIHNYYQSLYNWIQHAHKEGFINHNHSHLDHNDDYEPNKVYPSRRSWERRWMNLG